MFNFACDWCRKKLRSMNSNTSIVCNPISIFISGGAGVRKSHLVKTITLFLSKTFNLHSETPEKLKILLLAPTGVSAININGTTINSGLGIPIYANSITLTKLSDRKRSEFRNLYSDVVIVVINEVSMV